MMKYLSILTLFLFIACDKVPSRAHTPDLKNKNTAQTSVSEETPANNEFILGASFNTRLFPYLALKGSQCVGNETTQFEGQVVYCEIDQWLVTVDNQNTCDQNGCTSISVSAFVSKLEENINIRTNQYRFFEIVPVSTVRARQRQILRGVYLRANGRGNLIIVNR